MKAEKFFVIGSNSFTGATFVDYLLSSGCEVIGTTRSPEAASAFLPYKWPSQRPAGAQFKFAQLDLNDATEGLAVNLEGRSEWRHSTYCITVRVQHRNRCLSEFMTHVFPFPNAMVRSPQLDAISVS